MSHDKIKAAVRDRMTRTGEPYSVARRAVLAERGRTFFPLRYDAGGLFWMTKYGDRLFGGGAGRGGVRVEADRLRIAMGVFRLDVPRSSVHRVRRSDLRVRITSGAHFTPGGQVLLNGSGHGLVEFDVDPPVTGGRGIRAWLPRPPVRKVVLSLDDPDAFIAAVSSTDDRP